MNYIIQEKIYAPSVRFKNLNFNMIKYKLERRTKLNRNG